MDSSTRCLISPTPLSSICIDTTTSSIIYKELTSKIQKLPRSRKPQKDPERSRWTFFRSAVVSPSLKSGISLEEKKRLLHIVVIGGGPTGWSSVANEILSSFDISLRQYAMNHLTMSGVNLVRGVVKEVSATKNTLSDGIVVPYGLLVWSTGVGPSEFVKSLGFPRSLGGRIGIDQWLCIPSVEDVFALGDCAGFLEQTGQPVLPALAQLPVKSLKGKEKKYKHK